ncbi:tRNA (adenosine(37)-N6)-threonylcarbamoyltransferase complex ATPase subunit type 1 TsaE [Chitinophagaceae bacterium MMS25-I14]
MIQISYTLATIHEAARRFWAHAHTYRILAFSGQMGAGKTTFIHTLCEILGVPDAVSSPTFALINEYHFSENGQDQTIYHMDWYRVRDTDEAVNAGMEDALLSGAYCFVEWPEQATELFTSPYLWISIEETQPGERRMTIEIK